MLRDTKKKSAQKNAIFKNYSAKTSTNVLSLFTALHKRFNVLMVHTGF